MEQHASSAVQRVADPPTEIAVDAIETKEHPNDMDFLEESSPQNRSMENLSIDTEAEMRRGIRQEGDGKSMESEENGKLIEK